MWDFLEHSGTPVDEEVLHDHPHPAQNGKYSALMVREMQNSRGLGFRFTGLGFGV